MRYFKKIMNETIKYDLEAITKKKYSFPYLCYCIIKNRGFRYVFYLRMAGKKGIFKPLFMLLHSKLSHKMNNEISYKTKIGKGFTLGHPSSIVINPDAKLGEDISVSHGVTIGMVKSGKRQGVPKLNNHIYIGANASIVGGVTIGNDVLIAANSFVDFDVPDNSLVLGNPGIIKHKENACTKDYH